MYQNLHVQSHADATLHEQKEQLERWLQDDSFCSYPRWFQEYIEALFHDISEYADDPHGHRFNDD